MFWPIVASFDQIFTGQNSVVVYQNWQISGMIKMLFFSILCVQCLKVNNGDDASSFVFVSLTIRLSLPVRQDASGSVVHLYPRTFNSFFWQMCISVIKLIYMLLSENIGFACPSMIWFILRYFLEQNFAPESTASVLSIGENITLDWKTNFSTIMWICLVGNMASRFRFDGPTTKHGIVPLYD